MRVFLKTVFFLVFVIGCVNTVTMSHVSPLDPIDTAWNVLTILVGMFGFLFMKEHE